MAGENKVPYHTLAIHPSLGPYVYCDTLGHMSGLETVRLLQGF
jgi:hypothetical protein